jgi:hypothetical protein
VQALSLKEEIMSTRKTNASKNASSTSPGRAPRKVIKGRKARTLSTAAADLFGSVQHGTRRVDVAKYLTPGAAVLASGAVAALGYVFKDQIGDIVVEALKGVSARSMKITKAAGKGFDVTRDEAMDAVERMSDQMSMKSLLRHAGLQRKSVVGAILGPAIGVACGIVAGSALTYFFGPKLLEQLGDKGASANPSMSTHDSDDHATSASSSSEVERPRPNGGMHGGIS